LEGKVLNFDPEFRNGVVRASDGKRYRYDEKDCIDCPSLSVGDTVDFEPVGNVASEMLVVSSTATTDNSPLKRRASAKKEDVDPAAQPGSQDDILLRTRNWLFERPTIVVASLMIASCFLSYISTPELPFVEAQSISIMGIYSVLGILSGFADMAGVMGGGDTQDTVETILGFRRLLYFLYLVPAAAAYLLYKEYLRTATNRTRLRVGMIALLAPFGIPAITTILLSLYVSAQLSAELGRSSLGGGLGDISPSIETMLSIFGIGAWSVTILGGMMVAISKGWNPLSATKGELQACPDCASENALSNDFCRECGSAL